MQILDDFFMLVWNEKPNQHEAFETNKIEQAFEEESELLYDSFAILLSINPSNIEKIVPLEESKMLLSYCFGLSFLDKHTLQSAQKTILLYLIAKGNVLLNMAIAKRIDILRKEEIVAYDVSRKIISLLGSIEEKKVETKGLHVKPFIPQENFYKTALVKLLSLVEHLKLSTQSQTLLERLDKIPARLENQTFSIGVTGVMNAGKSTMLNALLGRDILGTAVVPETANLTIIRYAKEPYALVHYEDKQERIGLDEVVQYTSAREASKKYELVKSVELYTDLKFVQQGVIIVDTPGLDDPVVEREMITLAYLDTCDLLIHLMNASQVATKKDIDFIIDAILYRNVAQLLIVITRVDTIAQHVLQEVIDYTKSSIKARLEEQNRASKLDDIIAKIVFMPLCAKFALMHKMGRAPEALSLGYSMAQTGLPLLESYLDDVLFGEQSQKAHLIIASNQKEIEHIALSAKEALEQERHFLTISGEEMAEELAKHHAKQEEIKALLSKINSAIVEAIAQMEHYFETLFLLAMQKIDAVQNVLCKRVLEDVRYELSKNKKLPKEERIAYMLESGIKDGMVDLVRDYRYTFHKKMENILENMQVHYQEFTLEPLVYEGSNKGALVYKNSTVMIEKINEVIKKQAKNEPQKLVQSVDELLKEEFLVIKSMLKQKLEGENKELLEAFRALCLSPVSSIEEGVKVKGEMLAQAMQYLGDETLSKEHRYHDIHQKLERIAYVLEALQ